MARNLSRNTKFYISTLGPDGVGVLEFDATNCDGANSGANLGDNNTWKVQILDGYSFSQDVTTQEIGVSESASECTGVGNLARGTLGFNTGLNPVDVSFSTYVRPYDTTGALAGNNPSCVELPLWCAALGTETTMNASPGAAGTGTFAVASGGGAGLVDILTFSTETSDVNELMPLYLYFQLENTTYVIDNFTVGTAEVDFSIDGIATINWSGSGTAVNENETVDAIIDTFTAGTHYVDVPTTTSTSFLRNKLSTLTLEDEQGVKTTGDDTGLATTIAAGVITMTTTTDDWSGFTAATVASYVGGRIYSNTDDAFATILSITDADPGIVTVSAADATAVNLWNATGIYDIFTAANHAAVEYCIPITGATLTLENNVTYLTPEELAIVNQPLAGFTGSRAISGSFTAYLNTGAMSTGGLLQDLLAKITEVSNNFALTFHMGADSTVAPRVDFVIPHAQVSIPATNVEDVISTEISFTANSWTSGEQSFESANEMTIIYVTEA